MSPDDARTTIGRRQLLSGAAVLGAGAAAMPLLSACGSGTAKGSAASQVADLSAQEKKLVVANWTLYIDSSGDRHPSIDAFTKKTGITVEYNEEINDNAEFFAKLRPQLSAGSGVGRDIIVMTDWMAARLVRLGWVQELDDAKIPNKANLLPALKSPSFDPERRYSMPWQSGFTAIAYNNDVVDSPVTSIHELLTRPDLKGRVALFTEMRDTLGLVMLDLGFDPSEFTDDQFNQALAVVQDAVDSGQIRYFADANYGRDLARGDLAASMSYSGDVFQLQLDNPELRLVIPDAGVVLWSDNMLIPVGATHKSNAEAWMNYYYDPKVAAQVAAWVNFISPVVGAKDAMKSIDPKLAKSPLIFPTEEDLAGGRIFMALDANQDAAYSEQWAAVMGV
ncbi:MAG: spermidine/putrescine ABC transporter substrate-binding protein [Actinomycetes bacterium]